MGGIVTKTQSGINTAAVITGLEASATPAAKPTHFLPPLVLSGEAAQYLPVRRVYEAWPTAAEGARGRGHLHAALAGPRDLAAEASDVGRLCEIHHAVNKLMRQRNFKSSLDV